MVWWLVPLLALSILTLFALSHLTYTLFHPLASHHPLSLHAFHKSLGNIRGRTPSFDPYCAYLEDMPRKIMLSIFFDHAFDFCMAFDQFKRALTFFIMILLVFFYSHHFEMHAKAHDKLLRAVTTSVLKTQLSRCKEERLMFFKPS